MARTSTKNKTLIIDADSLLYESASVNEVVYEFGDESVTQTDLEGAKRGLDMQIKELLDKTKCKKYLMYITGVTNFRYKVLPNYKHNRADKPRPLLLPELKAYVLDNYPCKMTTQIEADDACSIHVSANPNTTILAHIDKDLNQVEGTHYNWRKDEFYELSFAEGQRFFYEQILTGDSTDGYQGCPGVGAVGAKNILDSYTQVKAYEHEFNKGVRAGESEIRWAEFEGKDVWQVILSHYLKGLYRQEVIKDAFNVDLVKPYALVQARVARMLRHDEFKFGNPILWRYKKLDFDLKNVKSYS